MWPGLPGHARDQDFIYTLGVVDLCVREPLRGRGLGERLMRAMLAVAEERRVDHAILVARDARLFRKLGFSPLVAEVAARVVAPPRRGRSADARVRTPLRPRASGKRLAAPGEVAQAALYLVSDASSFVTGTQLRGDGGVSIAG